MGFSPSIFRLIQQRVSTEEVLRQVTQDYHSPVPNPECVYLGVEELLMRGLEGHAALRYNLTGSHQFREFCLQAVELSHDYAVSLQALLGIKRTKVALTFSEDDPYVFMSSLYEHVRRRGLTTKTPLEFSSYMRLCIREQERMRDFGIPPSEDFFLFNSFFGVEEPSYWELVGSREILRLRAQERVPRFLLLGSLGAPSTRYFRDYARKIRSDALVSVIDIHKESIRRIVINLHGEFPLLVQGDVLALPYARGTFDHLYSNNLFDYLAIGSHSNFRVALTQLFHEAWTVLAPHGNFVILEKPYGDFEGVSDFRLMESEVVALACKAGFTVAGELDREWSFFLRPELGSVRVSNAGFVYYGDSFLSVAEPHKCFLKRFIKTS